MKRALLLAVFAVLAALTADQRGVVLAATSPMNCSLSGYRSAAGLTATAFRDSLAVTWDGDRNQELRLRFVNDNGTPTIAELAARKKGGAWGTLAGNVTPEFRVVSGRRRMDREAEEGLEENGIKEIISTTEAAGFGQRHFEIPFDATGKKWVRFAAWDVAGNGALVQPIKLAPAQTSTK